VLDVLDGTVIGQCMQRHRNQVFHFTPTSCSWLNAVEGFFARLTKRRLKRGTFPSLVSLQQAINRFIEHHNQEPRPFIWKADPKDIIAAAKRASNVTDNPLEDPDDAITVDISGAPEAIVKHIRIVPAHLERLINQGDEPGSAGRDLQAGIVVVLAQIADHRHQ
jgi:hypothetical protein